MPPIIIEPQVMDVLLRMADLDRERPGAYHRPRTISPGGTRERASARIRHLHSRGFVERRDVNPAAWREVAIYEYRISEVGRLALRERQAAAV